MAADRIDFEWAGQDIQYSPERHRYWINGKPAWGATSFLDGLLAKPFVSRWREKLLWESVDKFFGHPLDAETVENIKQEHKNKTSEAAIIGSVVHDFIENYRDGGFPTEAQAPEAQSAINAFVDFYRQWKCKPIMEEKVCVAKVMGANICGTFDWYGEITSPTGGTVRALIDWKTSARIYPEYWFQLEIYRIALEQAGYPVGVMGIVRLDKESGGYEFQYIHPNNDVGDDENESLKELLEIFVLVRRFRDKPERFLEITTVKQEKEDAS